MGKTSSDPIITVSAYSPNVFSRAERVEKCCEALTQHLIQLNQKKEAEVNDHINTAIENFIGNVHYRFVNPDGLRLGQVTKDEPLMHW